MTVLTILLGFTSCSTSIATPVPTDTSDTGSGLPACATAQGFSDQCEVRADGSCYDPVYREPGSGHFASIDLALQRAENYRANLTPESECVNLTVRPCDPRYVVVARVASTYYHAADIHDRELGTLVGWVWSSANKDGPHEACLSHAYFGPLEAEACALEALAEVVDRLDEGCSPVDFGCDPDLCIDIDPSVQ